MIYLLIKFRRGGAITQIITLLRNAIGVSSGYADPCADTAARLVSKLHACTRGRRYRKVSTEKL